jgi:hypothetical protein
VERGRAGDEVAHEREEKERYGVGAVSLGHEGEVDEQVVEDEGPCPRDVSLGRSQRDVGNRESGRGVVVQANVRMVAGIEDESTVGAEHRDADDPPQDGNRRFRRRQHVGDDVVRGPDDDPTRFSIDADGSVEIGGAGECVP